MLVIKNIDQKEIDKQMLDAIKKMEASEFIVRFSCCHFIPKALDSKEMSQNVRECYKTFIKPASGISVHLRLLKGHVGLGGKECTDTLAERISGMSYFGPEQNCGKSKTTTFHEINKWSRDLHCQEWQGYSGQALGNMLIYYRFTRLIMYIPKSKRTQPKR